MAHASGSLRLPAGEAGVLADTVRLAMGCVSGRRILGAYLLSDEQRSLLECQASDAATSAMPTADGEAFAFAWNAEHVRAMGLHATWRPLREAPLHPLEVSSTLSLPAQTEGQDDAFRALTAASRRSGRTAALLRVGAAVSAVKQAAAAAAARAAQFDATAVRADAAADIVAPPVGEDSNSTFMSCAPPAPAHLSSPPARLKVVDFLDRSIAYLTRSDGFSHLSVLRPRGEAEIAVPACPTIGSMELSMARIRAEGFLGAAAEAMAPAELSGHEASSDVAGRCANRPGGAEYEVSVVRPCVIHVPRPSEAATAQTRLALAAAERRARRERPGERQSDLDEGEPDAWTIGEPGAWHGALRGALPSRHDLPEQGNWVRLSAAQQVPASLPARAAHRPSVHSTFGSEPRLSSASRRWSYQTALPFTKRGAVPARAGGAEGRPVPGTAPAGSFLPLRLAAAGDSCHRGRGVQHAAQGTAATPRGHRRSEAPPVRSSPKHVYAAHELLGALSGLVGASGAAASGAQPSEGSGAGPLLCSGHSVTKETELARPSAWA